MKTLGWKEWVSLPELHLSPLEAKVDTGAKTSCLHAFSLEPFHKDGEQWIRFGMHPDRHSQEQEIFVEAKVSDRRVVSDSGGHKQLRWVIETPIVIAGETFPIEITLTGRDAMQYRMLLGRQAMRRRFVVDPAKAHLHPIDKQ